MRLSVRLGRSKLLRSSRRSKRTQGQGRHTSNRLEEKIKGSRRPSGLRGRDRHVCLLVDRLAGKASITSGSASRNIRGVEELETLHAGTKPRTSHHRSPGAERRGKRQRLTIFLERTWECHRQSDEQWNYFKSNARENHSGTGWSVYGLFLAHRYHHELN